MASKRITISIPAELADRLKRAAGTKQSVSAWVTEAIARALEDENLRERFLAWCESVEASPREIARAEAMFERIAKAPRRRRGKSAA